jgi:AraC-like DNA-binding protein
VHGIYFNSPYDILHNYPVVSKRHSNDFYTILLFTEGSGSFEVSNTTLKASSGTVCLISPFQDHSLAGLEQTKGMVLFFCQDFYVEEFSFIRLLNIFSCTSQVNGNSPGQSITLNEEEFRKINDITMLMLTEYAGYAPGDNSIIVLRSLLNVLLLRLSDQFDCRCAGSMKSESVFIHELSRMVDAYFISEHNLSFYTSAFNISEKQLNDICNRNFNCGLKKILTDRLMQEARKMLLSTELSAAEISYKLNFDDNSYFTKVFKKETGGLTPKKFRTLHRRLIP